MKRRKKETDNRKREDSTFSFLYTYLHLKTFFEHFLLLCTIFLLGKNVAVILSKFKLYSLILKTLANQDFNH